MKNISQQGLLRTVFKKVYGREFQASVMDDRVMLQKAVFLLREFGLSCGDYDFFWDHYGPFSPDLSDDMKREAVDDAELKFNQKAEKVMSILADAFSQNSEYSQRYWVETIASLQYISAYMYPLSSEDMVISTMENLKSNTLANHSENIRAMECLKKIFA